MVNWAITLKFDFPQFEGHQGRSQGYEHVYAQR